MAGGPRNATTTNRGRTYKWADEDFLSVTTILGRGVPKPALTGWAARTVAEYAVAHIGQLASNVAEDPAGAVDWLKGSPYRDRDKAAAKGTDVHAAAEAHILGRPMPEWDKDIAPSMHMFEKFLERFNPTFELSEASVFSRAHHYAGTLDFIAVFDSIDATLFGLPTGSPVRLLTDIKTGRGVYGEVALQLSAYAHADFIGMPDGTEVPMPAVDGAAVLHLRPQSYKLVPVVADETVFRSFLYAQQVAHFCDEVAAQCLLAPLGTEGDSPIVGAVA